MVYAITYACWDQGLSILVKQAIGDPYMLRRKGPVHL